MIIAIDTGGTKTLIIGFASDGTVMGQLKFPTPSDKNDYLEHIRSGIRQLSTGENIKAISIALPGVIKDQIALTCKNLGWQDFDVISALRNDWPNIPMLVENDANLGGVGAANLLTPLPARCLYVTISTGVGGGFIINQQIDAGTANNELGDIMFEYQGELIDWESIASGRAISQIYDQSLDDLTPEPVKQEIARRIARGLLAIIPIFRPETVALGGGLGAKTGFISDYLSQELHLLPTEYRCSVVTAPYPEEIVAYGCYYYAKTQLTL